MKNLIYAEFVKFFQRIAHGWMGERIVCTVGRGNVLCVVGQGKELRTVG